MGYKREGGVAHSEAVGYLGYERTLSIQALVPDSVADP
jgi:hypothetical protein